MVVVIPWRMEAGIVCACQDAVPGEGSIGVVLWRWCWSRLKHARSHQANMCMLRAAHITFFALGRPYGLTWGLGGPEVIHLAAWELLAWTNNTGLAILLFLRQVEFQLNVGFLYVVADEFWYSPSEIFTNWYRIRNLVVRTHIFS
jgi:hypothetical protein